MKIFENPLELAFSRPKSAKFDITLSLVMSNKV